MSEVVGVKRDGESADTPPHCGDLLLMVNDQLSATYSKVTEPI